MKQVILRVGSQLLSATVLLGFAATQAGTAIAQTPATVQNQQQPTEVEALPSSGVPGEAPYDRYMRLGYAASQRDEPRTALIYFRNALVYRPGDRLATIAYWNMYDKLLRSGTEIQPTFSEEQFDPAQFESTYDYYMNQGYSATEAGNYQVALTYFQQALDLRPQDTYAAQAIRNVTTYIQRGQANPQP